MGFPGEEIVSTAVEKLSDTLIQKMDHAEEKRNREFTYQLRELEFYKGNYDKEIKKIFDEWFDFLQNTLIITNKNVEDSVKRQYQREVDRFSKPEKCISLKIQTIKYCGTETGKILALFSQISYDTNKRGNIPKFAMVYVTCLLLSVMKREVLGQIIDPRTILKVLLVDYEEMADTVNEAAAYVEERRSELYLKEIEE